jgi:phospholipid/cholesterol/gamma-HCH transport system substrate-binding protein
MENKSHAIVSGVFVLLVAALLVTLAYWLTRDDTVRRGYEISSAEAITGLQPQAAVRYKGVPVGRVTGIALDSRERGHVLITISVDEKAPVTQSTVATLAFQGLTGLSYIQLDDQAGVAPEPLASVGDGLPRIPMRSNLMARLTEQGGAILSQVEQTTQRVNGLLAPQNQQALVKAITQLGEAAASISALSARTQAVLGPAQGPGSLNLPQLAEEAGASMRSLRLAAERVTASADAFKLASEDYRKLGQRLNAPGGTIERLNQSAESLSTTAKTLNSSLLPRVSRTAEDTQRAVRQVGQTAETLGEQPQSLLWGKAPVLPGPGEKGFVAPAGK